MLLWVKLAIFAAVFSAGAGTGAAVNGWRLNAKIGPLQAEVSRLQGRGKILENANAQCSESVKTCNESTGKLIAQAKVRERKAQEDVRIAKAEAAGLATSIAVLRSMPKPVGPPDALCSEARKLLADEVKSRAR